MKSGVICKSKTRKGCHFHSIHTVFIVTYCTRLCTLIKADDIRTELVFMKLPYNCLKGFIANAKTFVRKFITDSSPHHIIPRNVVLNFIFCKRWGAIITHFDSMQRCHERWKFTSEPTELSTWVITYITSLKSGRVLFYPSAHVLGVSIWNYKTLIQNKWPGLKKVNQSSCFV